MLNSIKQKDQIQKCEIWLQFTYFSDSSLIQANLGIKWLRGFKLGVFVYLVNTSTSRGASAILDYFKVSVLSTKLFRQEYSFQNYILHTRTRLVFVVSDRKLKSQPCRIQIFLIVCHLKGWHFNYRCRRSFQVQNHNYLEFLCYTWCYVSAMK